MNNEKMNQRKYRVKDDELRIVFHNSPRVQRLIANEKFRDSLPKNIRFTNDLQEIDNELHIGLFPVLIFKNLRNNQEVDMIISKIESYM